VVQRTCPEGLHIPVRSGGAELWRGVVERNAEEGVTWISSFVSEDKTRTFCIYDAPSPPEPIRKSAARDELPVDQTISALKSGNLSQATTLAAKGSGLDTEGDAKAKALGAAELRGRRDAAGVADDNRPRRPCVPAVGCLPAGALAPCPGGPGGPVVLAEGPSLSRVS
jgi:hypothetical protein